MAGIEKEAVVFFYACLSGVFLFFIYQILCWFRKLIVHKQWIIGLEDLIYWFGVSVYLFYQMYRTTYGEIRWYFVLGVFVGNVFSYKIVCFVRKKQRKYKKYLEKQKETR